MNHSSDPYKSDSFIQQKDYDKPSKAQIEARKLKERVELMKEEKMLNDEIREVWDD
jgi:hypothetical protein